MITLDNPQDQNVLDAVYANDQAHVLRFWDELNDSSRERLLNQLRAIDFQQLKALWNRVCCQKETEALVLNPPEIIRLPQTEEDRQRDREVALMGEAAIRQGKVAAFLVAGGQGSRLGYDGPKGCFPVGPVTGHSLFQMQAERLLATGRHYGVAIPWYIMTSESNDADTKAFFEKHDFFGLNSKDVFFFTQRMLPALDEQGKLILDARDHLFMNPNGHGGSLLALVESGAIRDMKERGIEVLSYYQVDNVLINIIDPVFIGYHLQYGAEMSSKMVEKSHAGEKVGVFGVAGGKLRVIEYSDMTDEDMNARNEDGSLKYGAGSIAIHLIDVDFAEEEVSGGFKLPWHIAHKKIPRLNEAGDLIQPDAPNGYKFETFVFDALQDTTDSVILEVRRQWEFSAVKNREGNDSPATARRDLCNYFGEWLEAAGATVPRDSEGNVVPALEISPLYALSREELAEKWQPETMGDALYLGPR